MWNKIYYFAMVPMVYGSFMILMLGLVFKLMIILLSPKVSATMGVFPRHVPAALGAVKDAFLAPAAFRKDKLFWFFIIAFHAAIILLVIGHLELIKEFRLFQVIPHEVMIGAGFVGVILIISTVYFLFRRFRSPYREISIMEDYILLILLFLTMLIGSHLHLAARYGVAGFDIPVSEYRVYLGSLVSLAPVIPDSITGSPHYVLVALHIFLANLVIALLPFTKMIHAVFTFFAQSIARR